MRARKIKVGVIAVVQINGNEMKLLLQRRWESLYWARTMEWTTCRMEGDDRRYKIGNYQMRLKSYGSDNIKHRETTQNSGLIGKDLAKESTKW